MDLGLAVGTWMREAKLPLRALVGRDTRASGSMLAAALSSGLAATGVEVARLGVATTPTIAFVTRHGDFGLGAVVSASHNPASDNGIKLLSGGGAKLSDDAEARIEELFSHKAPHRAAPEQVGKIFFDEADIEGHISYLCDLIPEGLTGLKVAMDCAHGAAFAIGPEVLRRLGAVVVDTGVEPNGVNINAEGGATKPDTICRLTKACGADLGVAFDGDADRVIFADSEGNLVNGDRTMGIWAVYQLEKGELAPASVVGTVMSNGGFEKYLSDHGIQLIRTAVGDKYVSRALAESGSHIGGEQSGHIVFPEHAPSGDGLLTMIELLRVIRRSGNSLTEWSRAYDPWPQLLLNVTVPNPKEWNKNPKVADEVDSVTAELAGKGRVNVRASGTQPMVRVMVEADSYELRDASAGRILEAMETELGAKVYSKVDLTHALGD